MSCKINRLKINIFSRVFVHLVYSDAVFLLYFRSCKLLICSALSFLKGKRAFFVAFLRLQIGVKVIFICITARLCLILLKMLFFCAKTMFLACFLGYLVHFTLQYACFSLAIS